MLEFVLEVSMNAVCDALIYISDQFIILLFTLEPMSGPG